MVSMIKKEYEIEINSYYIFRLLLKKNISMISWFVTVTVLKSKCSVITWDVLNYYSITINDYKVNFIPSETFKNRNLKNPFFPAATVVSVWYLIVPR